MTKLAEHILDTKAGHFDPAEFEHRYEAAVLEMLRKKQAGIPQKHEPDRPTPRNIVSLMDAMRYA
jgi:DNA end-binding protein Ku